MNVHRHPASARPTADDPATPIEHLTDRECWELAAFRARPRPPRVHRAGWRPPMWCPPISPSRIGRSTAAPPPARRPPRSPTIPRSRSRSTARRARSAGAWCSARRVAHGGAARDRPERSRRPDTVATAPDGRLPAHRAAARHRPTFHRRAPSARLTPRDGGGSRAARGRSAGVPRSRTSRRCSSRSRAARGRRRSRPGGGRDEEDRALHPRQHAEQKVQEDVRERVDRGGTGVEQRPARHHGGEPEDEPPRPHAVAQPVRRPFTEGERLRVRPVPVGEGAMRPTGHEGCTPRPASSRADPSRIMVSPPPPLCVRPAPCRGTLVPADGNERTREYERKDGCRIARARLDLTRLAARPRVRVF